MFWALRSLCCVRSVRKTQKTGTHVLVSAPDTFLRQFCSVRLETFREFISLDEVDLWCAVSSQSLRCVSGIRLSTLRFCRSHLVSMASGIFPQFSSVRFQSFGGSMSCYGAPLYCVATAGVLCILNCGWLGKPCPGGPGSGFGARCGARAGGGAWGCRRARSIATSRVHMARGRGG